MDFLRGLFNKPQEVYLGSYAGNWTEDHHVYKDGRLYRITEVRVRIDRACSSLDYLRYFSDIWGVALTEEEMARLDAKIRRASAQLEEEEY